MEFNLNDPLFKYTGAQFLDLIRYGQTQILEPLPQKVESVNSIDSGDLLTLKQVTHLFSKSRQTIRRWTKKGYIKAIEIENSRFYSKTAIEAFLRKKLG